jgi:KDO2-lipid IV(A) lauroyltransferase
MYIFPKISARALGILFSLMGCIPRRWALRLGKVTGSLWYFADKRHRNVALSNLHQAYGREKTPAEIEDLARRVFQNLAQIPLEICWSIRLGANEFLSHCAIQGHENLQAALAKGKGILFLSAHTGNWELLTMVISLAGIPVSGVYRPIKSQTIDLLVYEYRTRFGVKLIPKKHSMRKVLRCLGNNEGIGMLLDQDAGSSVGVFVDFFGRPACTNKGLALLALKTEAPVVPAFIARNGLGFRIEIGKEIPLLKTGEKSQDIAVNTQQYNKAIEEFVRRCPEQWFWVHRRWKSKPPR